MEFRLLGPVEAWVGNARVPLGGTKPRTLLAALLLEHDRVVPATRLVDLIWGDAPPETARALIQTYVSVLRRSFARFGVLDLIATRSPGYVVRIPPDALDRDLFERRLAAGLEHMANGDPEEAIDLLRAASALWRGPALAGLEHCLLAGEANRLNELRLTVLVERIEAELSLGRLDHLVAELTGLIDRHPTHERLRGQLMVALSWLGRQADALAVYHDARAVLADELGVEPGAELTAVHQSILCGDLPRARPKAPSVPAQLPQVPADFTGRRAEIEALTRAAPQGCLVIAGRAGSGKSTLAVRVAHQLAESYPDGQLHAALRGMSDVPVAPGEVLGRFLRALGVDAAKVPEYDDERGELYRTMLAGRRLVIVLDDARDERHVRELLPGTANCVVVITSRECLAGLPGVSLTELDVLDPAEAVELLGRVVGQERIRADRESAIRIVEHCGRLPLAIRIAGARLSSRKRLPPSWLADRLADESHRLNELSPGDLGVRASIGLSYDRLDDRNRTALRRLGYFGVPDFAPWLVAWLTGMPDADVEPLVDAQLVEFVGVDRLGNLRYRLHDLVRLYARERAEQEESRADLDGAVAMALGGWLSMIRRHAAMTPPDDISSYRTLVDLPEVATPTPTDPWAWFEAEQPALVAGVERAAALGLHDLACAFGGEQYSVVLGGANRFQLRGRIIEAGLEAARRVGDLRSEAAMLTDKGQLRYMQDRFADARLLYREALSKFRDLGDRRGQAVTLAGLGAACREPGRLTEAVHFLDQAVVSLTQLRDDTGVGYAARLAGSARLELGDYDGAWSNLDNALAAYRRAGSRRGEGLTLRTLALWHRALGEFERSAELCVESRAIFRELGDEFLEAYAVRALAKAHVRLGRHDEALAPLEWALSVCRMMHDRWGQAATLRGLGELHLAAGQLDLAEACLNAAMEGWATMEAPLSAARTERDLAQVYAARGDAERAATVLRRALKVFHDHGAREYDELRAAL
ncbi:BTAD domain-containing putative transcriptional regulator [Lentzea sp. NPDC051213]|uniref:AfsR/SARP family transcriptional regulator n=1 Tax=Lentzea sp. NPDC051213 TaxID=3364126 RepID=UPI0037AE5A2A